jgi:hypothetical protein
MGGPQALASSGTSNPDHVVGNAATATRQRTPGTRGPTSKPHNHRHVTILAASRFKHLFG